MSRPRVVAFVLWQTAIAGLLALIVYRVAETLPL
jgi:hypothetical protein